VQQGCFVSLLCVEPDGAYGYTSAEGNRNGKLSNIWYWIVLAVQVYWPRAELASKNHAEIAVVHVASR